MPYQIKNGIIYSGNAVTLTQAQYDALTTAEKNNGTVYYIYDSDAMIEAQEVGLDGGNVETLAGSVATFETSPSTAVHAEGEYILYQAQLYKVTSAIAVGEDLVVGSNIVATSVGNELKSTPTPFTGTVGGVTTTLYKFTIGGLIILAGVGAISSPQALGVRNIPIDISNGGITTLYGCSANIGGGGDAMSYTTYVSGSASNIDIWANFSTNVSHVIYTFIAIGI